MKEFLLFYRFENRLMFNADTVELVNLTLNAGME